LRLKENSPFFFFFSSNFTDFPTGKTTVLKQMRQCFDGGFQDSEKQDFKVAILADIKTSMGNILSAMGRMNIQLEGNLQAEKDNVLGDKPIDLKAVAALWKDGGVRKAFDRSREYDLSDSAAYFFNALDRLIASGYVPSTDDIMRVRIKTIGITETKLKVGQMTYNIVDVAGQKSERRKWLHQFETVTAMIYVIAISSFDQILAEDDSKSNRLQDAMKTFADVCQDRWFQKVSFIVFLNKIDLLGEKLAKSRFQEYISEYDGKNDVQSVATYYTNKINRLTQTDVRQAYVHLTCATDSEKFKFVILAVTDTITQNNLRNVGLL